MSKTINVIITIAARDFTKLVRDRRRIIASLIFPLIFIVFFGRGQQASIGEDIGFNVLEVVFIGVLSQTLFQSTASGIISLVEDKQNDFAQEMFIAPISRYAIIFGKILGESLVAFVQASGVLAFALIMQISLSPQQILSFIPIFITSSLLGGAFGVVIMSLLDDYKAVNQIFPFVIFPQFFLAGVFFPIVGDPVTVALSRFAPMAYVVDFARGLFFAQKPAEYAATVVNDPLVNLFFIGLLFVALMALGTWLFIRGERNR